MTKPGDAQDSPRALLGMVRSVVFVAREAAGPIAQTALDEGGP